MSCKTILPINIDEKLNTLDLVGCKRLEDINEQIKKIDNFNNALKIDEKFLDLLKDEWGVDFWNEISELEKRKLIDKSKFYYKKIGTVYAIKEVLKIFDIDTKLKEWFDFNGEPYHFKVILTPLNTEYKFDEVMFKKIVSLIDSVKNIRSVLDGFEFELKGKIEIKEYCGVNTKASLNKEYRYKKIKEFNIMETQGINTKTFLNKEYRYKKTDDIKFEIFDGMNINAVLEKKYNYKQEKKVNFKDYCGVNIDISLNTSDTKIPLNNDFNLDTKGVSNVYLNNEIKLQTLSFKSNIQGAVIWLV